MDKTKFSLCRRNRKDRSNSRSHTTKKSYYNKITTEY